MGFAEKAWNFIRRCSPFTVSFKILKHVGLWDVQKRPPPRDNSPPSILVTDYADIQSTEQQYCAPDYLFKAYLT
jgi:hypothetical protein